MGRKASNPVSSREQIQEHILGGGDVLLWESHVHLLSLTHPERRGGQSGEFCSPIAAHLLWPSLPPGVLGWLGMMGAVVLTGWRAGALLKGSQGCAATPPGSPSFAAVPPPAKGCPPASSPGPAAPPAAGSSPRRRRAARSRCPAGKGRAPGRRGARGPPAPAPCRRAGRRCPR